jgi:hypothetical protein
MPRCTKFMSKLFVFECRLYLCNHYFMSELICCLLLVVVGLELMSSSANISVLMFCDLSL